MNSLYYSQYNDHIYINEDIYSSIDINQYVDDVNVIIEFDGSNCCQISNITTIPTIDNNTNININTQLKDINSICEYNDINYSSSNLSHEFTTKQSLQFSSLTIDTYLEKSEYLSNHVTNKIVSIHENDDNIDELETLLNNLSNFHNSIIENNIIKIPKDISVKCLFNDEYIWRSDESLTHLYGLPKLLIKVMFNEQYEITKINFVHSYNNFTYTTNTLTIYDYDENANHTNFRTFNVDEIQKLIQNKYIDYIQNCISNVNSTKYYYFYLVNLTTEFIHFENIADYDFNSDNALFQYTLLVFNDSMTNSKLLSNDEINHQFVNSWKMKNKKKTVDDIKVIVENIKSEYDKCSKLLLNLQNETTND